MGDLDTNQIITIVFGSVAILLFIIFIIVYANKDMIHIASSHKSKTAAPSNLTLSNADSIAMGTNDDSIMYNWNV